MIVSTSSPWTRGVPVAADAALTDVTPGHDHRVEALGQPGVHVHVGAVEQRIALGEQCDVAAGLQMGGDALGGLAVEVLHRAGVAAGMVGGLGGDRVDQMLLDLAGTQIRLGDAASDAAPVPGAVIRDDVGLRDHPGGLDRHEFRVARTQPDAPQRSAASRSFRATGDRVDGGGGHRAAAAATGDHEIGHAARVGR